MSLLLLFNEPYHCALLESARRLLSEKQPAIALVTAHMACEIYTEQLLAMAIKKRAFGSELEKAIGALARGHITNKRVRNLYVALTGDPIHKAFLWEPFNTSWDIRNLAVHGGVRVSMDQGSVACEIARDYVAHLDAVAKTL